ncbi:long-chain fatty acid--CoA ligase [Georgenia halophila]|uniref:Long-chain fatty acid--CoA ligase n=1 Tax=Georgenia halophila TaxID=620889 RepID=A0ABP8KSP0_9MICO
MHNQGIGSWLHRCRIRSAGRTALVTGGRSLTYEQLLERVDRLADALGRRGVRRGDRVAYLGENDTSFLETLFAAATLGAIFVPLNTRWAAPEIQYGLQDSGARTLVFAEALAGTAVRGCADTDVSDRIVVAAPSDGTTDAEDYEVLLASGRPEHRDEPVTLEDPALILYTSGTTGRPKGAVLTHGNLTWNAINTVIDYDVHDGEVALMISPMFHVASLGMGVLPTILKGGTIILEAKFDPGRALDLIQRHAITYLSGVPTTYQMLAEHPDWDGADLSSLRKLTCGGSTVPLRILEAYEARGLSFTQGYGMTETSPGATGLMPGRSRDKMGSVGLPMFFSDVRVAGVDGTPAAPGEVAEIQICGPNVIREYWNNPEATAESRTDDGWFRSGDLGYLDEEGFLFVSDRLKDMVISGGENIYPAEVEQVIAELDGVGSVAVIGRPDPRWGEVPVAVVTVREGFTVTAEEVLGHLDGRLARYKIPKQVTFVEDMPRTASGKIRKTDLRKQYGT